MTEQPPAPVVKRSHARLLIVVVLAVVVAAGAVVWLVVGGNRAAGTAAAVGPIPLPGHQVCADGVRITATTDAQMRHIATVLLADPRVTKVYTETQQQALQDFQQEFAAEPDLRTLARPGVLPASVRAVTAAGVDVDALAREYRTKFDVRQVQAVTRADASKALAAIGETAPAVPCPASGEFPSR